MRPSLTTLSLLAVLLLAPLAALHAADDPPFAPKVELSRELVPAGPPTYVPAQTFAAFPDRMLPSYRGFLEGIKQLIPDNFTPVEGGIALLPGKTGSFVIHHRRAGVRCHENLVFQMRLEMVQQLASLRLGLQVNERLAWLSELPLKQMTYFPGRVRYELEDSKRQLAVAVDVIAPAVTPAYGFIAKVSVSNLAATDVDLKLLALGSAGVLPPKPLAGDKLDADHLRIDCAKEATALKLRIPYDTSTLDEVPLVDRGGTFEQASADLRFAGAVAAFGMVLRNSGYKGEATLPLVAKIAAGALGPDRGGYRAEFLDLVRKAETLRDGGR